MQEMMGQPRGPLVVAVSGGIDSVVLLDMLVQRGVELVVAHVDHGIRSDSHEDEALVRRLAESHGLPFVSTKLALGSLASEELARQKRYEWLEVIRSQYKAAAIATAHHQDDVLETIVINLLRGTGWRGLCSLRETGTRHRPLLGWDKARIVGYAIEHSLEWREDSTNEDIRYLRNRIRHQVIPRFAPQERQGLLGLYQMQLKLREEVSGELQPLLSRYSQNGAIGRYPLVMVPDEVAYELLRAWLGQPLERQRMRDLLLFCKTGREGTKWSLDGARFVAIKEHRLIVQSSRD